MSEGMRSGVNWIRLNDIERSLERLEIMSVFASPGTPSRMQCPLQNRAVRRRSRTCSWPTITVPRARVILRWASATISASAATAEGSREALVAADDIGKFLDDFLTRSRRLVKDPFGPPRGR
jgi:hypothetical protein